MKQGLEMKSYTLFLVEIYWQMMQFMKTVMATWLMMTVTAPRFNSFPFSFSGPAFQE
jgi:hypothetical protein